MLCPKIGLHKNVSFILTHITTIVLAKGLNYIFDLFLCSDKLRRKVNNLARDKEKLERDVETKRKDVEEQKNIRDR